MEILQKQNVTNISPSMSAPIMRITIGLGISTLILLVTMSHVLTWLKLFGNSISQSPNAIPGVAADQGELTILAIGIFSLLLHHRITLRLEFIAGFPFRKFVSVGDLVADFE